MSDVKQTVNKVVDSMIRDHGYEYTAGFLNTFLIKVIEKSVESEVEKSVLLIELLGAGIESRIDAIKV